MYRLTELVKSFSTLVGWKDTALDKSESGLYYQEANPLLTLRALRGVMPKDLADRYPAYEQGRIYDKGVKVSKGGKIYLSLKDENNQDLANTLYWTEYDVLEDYLSAITERGIKKAIVKVVNEKIIGLESKNLVDRRVLFDGAGRKEARTPNRGNLVGFEITPIRTQGITTTLNKVGIQMYGNVGDVKLYLFHSSQPEPIDTKVITINKSNGTFMWVDLDWVLPYVNDEINAGGSWYVVYNQAALPPYMESINFGRDWSREPCGTCNKGDLQLYRLMQKYVTLSPFYVVISDWDETLWDIEDNIYTPADNYGLNMMFTMACDVTETLIAEKFQFANLIQLQVASEALRDIATNPEVAVNRTQSNVDRNNVLFEVFGDGQGVRGIQGELTRAYNAIAVDLKGLDPLCMTCKNKGIRYGTII
jgi:hypothetical protein